MQQYDKKILNALLDSYERSSLSRGENKVAVHISFDFTRKILPEYFDESSIKYEEIHAYIRDLEQRGWIQIIWRRNKENHIVDKVILREEKVQEVYRYLHRIPQTVLIQKNLELLKEMKKTGCKGEICKRFTEYLMKRLKDGKSVKEFLNLADPEKNRQLIQAVDLVENNRTSYYVREFSIEHFQDTKVFEQISGMVVKIIRRFDPKQKEKDAKEILAEYSIYHTPNYIYLKGNGTLCIKNEHIKLSLFQQGIGISGEDVQFLQLTDLENVKKVITIENLTTFFRWMEEDSLIVYLGGYHNAVRQQLLQMIYRKIPHAEYLHFGDIDAGGYEIYENLCRKTGILFGTYYMNLETLQTYESYARKLTENDRKRLNKLLEKQDCKYRDVLGYMLEKNIKLEQECIAPVHMLRIGGMN